MNWILNVLKGIVIGLANVIPGVSGGTMMVSMGIYEPLIHSITHLFKEFRKSIMTLLPFIVGMGIAIVFGAFGLKAAFQNFPLPTNTLFVGLILGSIPAIYNEMKNEKKGVPGALLFFLFFAIVVVLKAIEADNSGTITLSVGEIIKLFFLGALASSTMVIPGVSGSMLLKTFGYYEPIVTVAIPGAVNALRAGAWGELATNIGILLPFAIGIVIGIFSIAQLIEMLMKKAKGLTYCAIMGMVIASPVVIFMDRSIYVGANAFLIVISVVTFALGLLIALNLSGNKAKQSK